MMFPSIRSIYVVIFYCTVKADRFWFEVILTSNLQTKSEKNKKDEVFNIKGKTG
jgi:hypothetical protein